MENAGQFGFRCEANNSIQVIGKSSNTTLTVDGGFEVIFLTKFSCMLKQNIIYKYPMTQKD